MRAKREIRHLTHEIRRHLFHFPWHTFVFVKHPSTDSHAIRYTKCFNWYIRFILYGSVTIGGKSPGNASIYSDFTGRNSMLARRFKLFIALVVVIIMASGSAEAQVRSQEVSEVDGEPVLLKHLPDYERVRGGAAFVTDKAELGGLIGRDVPVLDSVEFPIGTEAAVATYPQGQLLIVEYTNPQLSSEVDAGIQQYIASNPQPGFVYRRIGNYNAFVFGPTDTTQADALLDQVKYEKTVQWLGEDPFLLQKIERYMAITGRDIALSTVMVIVLGLSTALVAGIFTGFIFFRFRDQKRASRSAFSDAGGLTRLNLDGLSE
jgi:hypothetical protein